MRLLRLYIVAMLGLLPYAGLGQNAPDHIKFFISDSISFMQDGQKLRNPFTGGFNLPVVNHADLNNNGKPDLVVYDRSSRNILTFINSGRPNNYQYDYAPEYEFLFNDIKPTTFMLFRDFNRDGKEDLFILEGPSNRMRVYKNITSEQDTFIQFEKMGLIEARNMSNGPIRYNIMGGRSFDLPVIYDIDGDGDLDYISFEPRYGNLQLFLNEQVERGLPNDTFAFRFVDMCWGGFQEASNNEIRLFCPKSWFPNNYSTANREEIPDRRHETGTTLFAIDMDGDGDVELIMGNGWYQNLIYLKNGRAELGLPYDSMISYETYFPEPGEKQVQFKYMPALYHLDVDGDGLKDLIASPFFMDQFISTQNMWFLKNTGTASKPEFEIQDRNFLTSTTLDFGNQTTPIFYDLNGDGEDDLFLVVEPDSSRFPEQRFSRIIRFQNIGTQKEPIYEVANDDFASFSDLRFESAQVTFGDLDGDGIPDMVVGDRPGRISYLRNMSTSPSLDPEFLLITQNLLGHTVDFFTAPTLFDYSGNGKLDLIIGKADGRFAYYANVTTGTGIPVFQKITDSLGRIKTNFFNTSFSTPAFESMGMSAPTFFDFDLDGKPELVSGTSSGHIKIWNISYNPNNTFPEISNFYGVINASGDTTMNTRLGGNTRVAVTRFSDSGKAEVLVGTNRGGLRFLSARAEPPKRINVTEIPTKQLFFNVYPNPNQGSFQLLLPPELSQKNLELNIYSYSGKNVARINLDSYQDNVDLPLASGVYFATLKDQNATIARTRFVVSQ